MLVRPPQGSAITVVSNGSNATISVPPRKRSGAAYFVGAFILFWLGGWAFGEVTAINMLLNGPPASAKLFMVFWLCAWSVGGAAALLFVRRILQRPVPETITLEAGGLVHDPGVPPVQFEMSRRLPWSEIFPRRTVARIDRRGLETLRLREADAGNRLTVDSGVDRIALARAATDIEREWLYRALVERYSIPVRPGSAR
jgi:hypothetical protein